LQAATLLLQLNAIMKNSSPLSFYQQRIAQLSNTLGKLKHRYALLGWVRLLTIAALIITVYLLRDKGLIVVLAVCVLLLGVFLYLVSVALATNQHIQNISRLLTVNNDELAALDGHYSNRSDGANYISEFQLPDNDLDLFGNASLFQYINRANSYHGKLALAAAFINVPTAEIVIEKQVAIKELADDPAWCQQLQSYTIIAPVSKETENIIMAWLHDNSAHFDKPIWQVLRYAVPVISFTTLVLYIGDYITDGLFNTIMLLMLAFVFSFYKKITKQYSHISKIIPELNAFLPTLQWIENAGFKASVFQTKQAAFAVRNSKASFEIAKLKAILKRFDYRLNPIVHLPLSAFLFWDLQQVLAMEKWKKLQTAHLSKWFEMAGDVEMLSSLAITAFNHPNWVFPIITPSWFELECKDIGHPLIRENKIVTNDFCMKGAPHFALITGSNMAGKSTFLRTIGANMVLAMIGAPVRATCMKLPVVRIISSMRIADNLEEETSTFYAELKKMKRIVEAANKGERVFILVDEMLRGTNTTDRQTGSIALIKQLLRHGAVGIIASHDIALAELEKQYPTQLTNYHFDSTIAREDIVFDYRIKDGICHSTNASLLMKKIGIEMDAG
jgi:hypothetical protein